MRKLKILFHSNDIRALTGLGKNAKALLTYLAKTEKYEITQLAAGINKNNRELTHRPWKTLGTLPNEKERRDTFMGDRRMKNLAIYGQYIIDEIIEEIKPDVYIGSEDIWAFSECVDKNWWQNLQTIVHTTLDSVPIHSEIFLYAENSTKFLVWSEFAKAEMHKVGYSDVECVPGVLNTEKFFRLNNEKRLELRNGTAIKPDSFVVGFVFRNQLRKTVPSLLEGFKKFQDATCSNSFLLLHTNWVDPDNGWNIAKLIAEIGVDPTKILTPYYCKECHNYTVAPYIGEGLNCDKCSSKESLNSPDSIHGVNDKQLNEIYNLMDVYCHPFTSGGQEIPILEAKLTEIPTLVTDYSCGISYSQPDTGSLPLSWEPYRLPDHNQFIKAATTPTSVNRQLKKVYAMSEEKRREYGKRGKEFVKRNFSIEIVGPKWEKILDKMLPIENWDISFEPKFTNPQYQPSKEKKTDEEFVVEMYNGFLNMKMVTKHPDAKHWIGFLKKTKNRKKMAEHFQKLSVEIGNKKRNEYNITNGFKEKPIEKFLNPNENVEDRICVIMPESIGDIIMATSLLENLKERYKKKIYFATKPQYFYLLEGNPFIEKVIPYSNEMDVTFQLEGTKSMEAYFYMSFPLHLGPQRMADYSHHGRDIPD